MTGDLLAAKLFTSDLPADGRKPLVVDETRGEVRASQTMSLDLPLPPLTGTIVDLFGSDHDVLDPTFAGVLAELWRRRKTAVLEVQAGAIQTTIYLLDGMPMFAANGALEDTLGQLLIRLGRLTEDQLDRALEHYLDRYDGTTKRVGEVFVELGMCTPEQITDALHIQTREKILRCFQSKEVRFRLERNSDAVKTMPRFTCTVPSLLKEGIRRHYDAPRLNAVLEAFSRCFPGLSITKEEVVPALLGEIRSRSPAPDDDDEGAIRDAFDLPVHERATRVFSKGRERDAGR